MDLKHGVELSDGEKDARTQAMEAIAKAVGCGRDAAQDQPVDPEVAWGKANADRVIAVAAALAGGLMARPGFVETLKPKSIVNQAAAIVREVTDRAADPYSGE